MLNDLPFKSPCSVISA